MQPPLQQVTKTDNATPSQPVPGGSGPDSARRATDGSGSNASSFVAQGPTTESDNETSALASALNSPVESKKNFIGALLLDSQQKCSAFVNRIGVAQNGINATGDVLTTILSGVATAVSPIAVSHGFSAASTIIGASKTALDQDFWAKSGVQDFQKALSSSYGASLKAYSEALANQQYINLPLEVQKVNSIHSLCNVGSALSVITATLSSTTQSSGAPVSPSGATSIAISGQSVQSYAVQGVGYSKSPTANALHAFLDQPGLTDTERKARNLLIEQTAQKLGYGEVVVSSLLADTAVGSDERRTVIARSLGLLP
jgi:hypothetical protein